MGSLRTMADVGAIVVERLETVGLSARIANHFC